MERRELRELRDRRKLPYKKPHQEKDRVKRQFIKKSRDLIILDVLSRGKPDENKPTWARTPVAQVLTFPDFVLYEVKSNKNSNIQAPEKNTYENFLKDNKLREVLKKIDYNDLTNAAKALIQPILEKEVLNYEEDFVNFFNNSTSITPRMHALKLIPGIGQKHMWGILKEREKQKFTSFQDIAERTSISNPAKQMALRIIKELQREDAKYYLFSKTKKYEKIA